MAVARTTKTPVKREKLYYSITEVGEMTGLKPHILRYWESEFPFLRPKRNRAGNRIYRKKDIELIMLIKKLLYEARFPQSTKVVVSTKSFPRTLHNAPKGDIHLIPIVKDTDLTNIRKISDNEDKSFFFVMDSGKEDVLA